MVNVKYCILGVEGPHDQAFTGKLLKLYGMEEFKGQSDSLEPFWQKFIPTYRKDRLYVRLDMPTIFSSSTHSVAVYQGNGSDLIKNLKAKIGEHDPYMKDIHAFGLILDADDVTKLTPQQKATKSAKELRELYPDLIGEPGIVVASKPRTGIYVLPDNKRRGTLDSILIDCAAIIYPDHKAGAIQYLDSLGAVHRKHWKPFDLHREKAIVATIVSVLKPGAANTPSIAQDRWICEKTVNEVAEVALFDEFLEDLLELSEG